MGWMRSSAAGMGTSEVRLRLGNGFNLLKGWNSGASNAGDGPRYILWNFEEESESEKSGDL